ncbi:MAG: RNA polymerase sigma factor [Xanthobacteraceae bacterium]|jgi:RNA polymerase sigma-70 factor (ECF subfamily)
MAIGESSEQLLLERLARGDELAWGQVFSANRDRIYGFCLRMMRNREEAEDVSQEVFLRAVRAIGAFRGESSIKTWLHQIAHNLCLTRLAAAKKRSEQSSDLIWLSEVTDGGPSGDAAMASGELRNAIELAVSELDPVFREVLLLREVEDLSYEEIAGVVGASVNTVKTRIHRARAKLQQQLVEFR